MPNPGSVGRSVALTIGQSDPGRLCHLCPTITHLAWDWGHTWPPSTQNEPTDPATQAAPAHLPQKLTSLCSPSTEPMPTLPPIVPQRGGFICSGSLCWSPGCELLRLLGAEYDTCSGSVTAPGGRSGVPRSYWLPCSHTVPLPHLSGERIILP